MCLLPVEHLPCLKVSCLKVSCLKVSCLKVSCLKVSCLKVSCLKAVLHSVGIKGLMYVVLSEIKHIHYFCLLDVTFVVAFLNDSKSLPVMVEHSNYFLNCFIGR